MNQAHGPTLVITDGGLPAMLAAAIEAERQACADGGGTAALLMPWVTSPALADAQLEAIDAQARFFGQSVLPPAPVRDLAAGASPAYLQSLGLLTAVEAARANDCRRVVWPAHEHATDDTLAGQIDRIAAAADRALLVARVAMLDADPAEPDLGIETPLVDLTDAQVADLVVDLDAPVWLCWWWRRLQDSVERMAGAERGRWRASLTVAGWVFAGPPVQAVTPMAAEVTRSAAESS